MVNRDISMPQNIYIYIGIEMLAVENILLPRVGAQIYVNRFSASNATLQFCS